MQSRARHQKSVRDFRVCATNAPGDGDVTMIGRGRCWNLESPSRRDKGKTCSQLAACLM